MKKYLFLILLLLTGCVKNELNDTCYKEEKNNDYYSKTTYEFQYKNDLIESLKIINEYEADENTIKAFKLSTTSQNNFFKDLNFNVITDTDKKYKVEYIIDLNNENEIYEHFKVKKERSKLVSYLEETGFTCR